MIGAHKPVFQECDTFANICQMKMQPILVQLNSMQPATGGEAHGLFFHIVSRKTEFKHHQQAPLCLRVETV